MADTSPPDHQEAESGNEGLLRPFVDGVHEPLPPIIPPQFISPTLAGTDSTPSSSNVSVNDHGGISISARLLGLVSVVVVLLFAVLVYLWQTAGDGGGSTIAAQSDLGAVPGEPTNAVGTGEILSDSTPLDNSVATAADGLSTADLEAEVAALRDELSFAAVPALPGTSLQRIVISADVAFVSASAVSVAAVGPYGNYANIDPADNSVTAAGQVSSGATRVIRTPSSVWITSYHDSKLVWVDPVTNTVRYSFDFPAPDGLAKDGGSLLVSSFDRGFVARFDPGVGKVIEQVNVGGTPTAVAPGPDGGIWALIFDTGELVRIEPSTFTISDRIPVGAGPMGLAFSPDTVWVANHDEGTVAEVSIPERKVINTVEVGSGPTELLVDAGSLWVTVTDAGEVVQLSVETGEIITRTPVGGVAAGGGPTGISAGAGSIWVAIEGEQSVVRITPPA